MYTTKMAKLMKNLNPFNRSSGKTKEPVSPSATKKDQDSSSTTPEPSKGDNINRRRLSISKSGRYKENNKRRSALHHDDEIDKENICATDVVMNEKDKKNWENRNKQETISNNNNINNNNSLGSINNNKYVSSLGRLSSLSNYDTLDGHAVADEIESLAKTLTLENNSRILNTDL